jgi:glutamyl-tRNA synthetase
LYNYLFARKNGGKFILRIDDTDTKRNSIDRKKASWKACAGLGWLGMKVPMSVAPMALPSERASDLYHKYVQQLLDEVKPMNAIAPRRTGSRARSPNARKEDPRYSGVACIYDEQKARLLQKVASLPFA